MTTTVCPHCGSLLRSEEERQGRCSACLRRLSSGIQAEQPRPVRSAAWGDERPDLLPRSRRRATRPGGEGWTAVRAGLACLASAALLCLLTILGGTFAAFVARRSPGAVVLLGVFQLLSGVLGLAGLCLCCCAPRASGMRSLALGSLVCLLLALVLVLGALALDIFLQLPKPDDLAALGFGGCVLILVLTAGPLFFLFLRGVARHFASRHLASECMVCGVAAELFLSASGTVLGWSLMDFEPLGRHILAPVAVFFCGGFGFSLILLLWLFSLFVRLRDLIPPAAPWREPAGPLESPS